MTSPAARTLTPSACLGWLGEPELDIADDAHEDHLRQTALRRSILPIAELDHTTETALVHVAISNALAEQPDSAP
jgi:hypothetical protein